MTRVLPAHVVAAAAVVGLALSNFVRVSFGTSWVAALGALLVLAAVPRAGALTLGAFAVLGSSTWRRARASPTRSRGPAG